MTKQQCAHTWELIHIRGGLIIIKKCFHCGKVSSCFGPYETPPLETCHEDEHFWNFMESNNSFRFDLQCTKCHTEVRLDGLIGLMQCTGCDEKCEVDVLRKKLESEKTEVLIALGARPIEDRKQLSPEKLTILQEFIEQQNVRSKTKFKLVGHEMVLSLDNCYAKVIEQADMLCDVSAEK